jgi:hypothetical protein
MVALILAFLLPLIQGPTLSEVDAAREALRPFLDALAVVESNGKDDAVGDNGNALGRYQLWQAYWQDATEHCPEIGGRYKDVTNKVYAERCVVAYLMRYCPKAVADADFQTMARIHNGGPKGHKRKATLGYWKKVERALASR